MHYIILYILFLGFGAANCFAQDKVQDKSQNAKEEKKEDEYNLSLSSLAKDAKNNIREDIQESQNFTVTIGGFLDFQASSSDERISSPKRANVFTNNTEIHIRAESEINELATIGAVVELEADVSQADDNQGVNADKTYIFADTQYGKVELGANSGIEDQLKVDASTIAFGTGGADGDYYNYINIGGFLFSPDLFPQSKKGVAEDANKLTYISPIMAGFQLGISYAPDSGDGGTADYSSGKNNIGDYQNMTSAALAYEKIYGNLALQGSITGLFAQSEASGFKDLNQYALGLAMHYKGFSIAGSYGNWGKYTDLVLGSSDAHFYTVGTAYEIGPLGASINFLSSENAYGKLYNTSVGFSLEFIKGLKPYLEANFFNAENKDGSTFNKGTVILTGTEVIF